MFFFLANSISFLMIEKSNLLVKYTHNAMDIHKLFLVSLDCDRLDSILYP